MTTGPSSAAAPREPRTATEPPLTPPRRLRSAARFLAAVALPWILLEAGLRVVGWQPPDMRPRVALFPRFPDIYEPQRELGWVLKPNLEWHGMDVAIPFRTDAAGHRAHGEAVATSGTLAVDAIGDSSTFGFGVPADETYPAVLERRLRDATGDPSLRVRNLGVPGYTSYEARILAERDDARAPVTLIMMGFNDHFPATRTRFTSLWVRRAAYACFRSRACALFFDRATRPDPDAPPPPPRVVDRYVPDVAPDEYRDQLVRTVRALRAGGSEPILLVYPSIAMTEGLREQIADYWKQPLDQVDANLAAHTAYQQLTRDVAASEGVRVVDLPPLFDAAGNVRLHFDWVHPNAEGQALIADTVVGPVRDALATLGALSAPAPPPPACASPVRACAQDGVARCGTTLGPWRIARSRTSGLDPAHAHSACILAAAQRADGAHGAAPVISILPQPIDVAGDTLLSRAPAPRRDAQRAGVRIDVRGSLPDHWDFAVAGGFLDVGDAHACDGLAIAPPRNAGYALIAGNWERRPHGFYFERLADACVYDGRDPACPGEHAFVAHEFVPDESFLVDLELVRRDDGWWLDATVASPDDANGGTRVRELARMRLRVAAPCWLAADDPGRAGVIVIPHPDPATLHPATRVDVSGFAWRDVRRPE